MIQQLKIEFVGGPYDGYVQPVGSETSTFLPEVAVPVSENTILAAGGQEHGPLFPCGRLALYRLARVDGLSKYYFEGELSCAGT